MTYLEWLNKQCGDTPVVDLKNDIMADDNFPRSNKVADMRGYLVSKHVPLQVMKVFLYSYATYLQDVREDVKQCEAEFLREIEEAGNGDF